MLTVYDPWCNTMGVRVDKVQTIPGMLLHLIPIPSHFNSTFNSLDSRNWNVGGKLDLNLSEVCINVLKINT